MVWMGADCHLYLNHEHLVTAQLAREPRVFPHFEILRRPDDIFGYAIEDFRVTGYDPHPAIAAPVAV
jgi:thymidylate synthase